MCIVKNLVGFDKKPCRQDKNLAYKIGLGKEDAELTNYSVRVATVSNLAKNGKDLSQFLSLQPHISHLKTIIMP